MRNDNELLIKIENLSKFYKLYNKPSDRLIESLHPFKKKYHKDFAAIKDVSLTINKGEAIGIIGKNGAGKSTLLKIITGVLSPSSGEIEVNGKISALLELGAGFNPEFTGLENIYLNGTIMGFTKEEMDNKLPDILSFADIGEFIHQPVKTYSSGMFARLAFSVSINVEPDILIVDEALSVGDMYFQAKCMKKIKELMEKGVTTLFVSHDTMAVKSLCTRAVYIDHGTIIADGHSGEVCDQYINDTNRNIGAFKQEVRDVKSTHNESYNSYNIMEKKTLDEFKNRIKDFRNGSQAVEILYVSTFNDTDEQCNEFVFNEKMKIRVFYQANEEIDNLIIAFYIKDKNQLEVIGTNTVYEQIELTNLGSGEVGYIEFTFDNRLMAGNYSITLICANSLSSTLYYDWVDNAAVFKSLDEPLKKRWSLVSLPMEVSSIKLN